MDRVDKFKKIWKLKKSLEHEQEMSKNLTFTSEVLTTKKNFGNNSSDKSKKTCINNSKYAAEDL